MLTGFGRFAGKSAFGSSQGTYYLTTLTRKNGSERLRLPAMMATAISEEEHCQLYTQPDGTLRIRLGSLLWISLNQGLGWLETTDDFAGAAAFKLAGDSSAQSWQVQTNAGWAGVSYTVDNLTPLLTTNGDSAALSSFVVTVITPPLDAIRKARSAPGADLRQVDLSGQDLSGLDLTRADFTSGDLRGAKFDRSPLTGAKFVKATLADATFDQATLDQADFTKATLIPRFAWGSPKSARKILLTDASARGAVLGGQSRPLDCTEANLARGDFRGADLRGLILTNVQAGGALLAGCKLDGAVLDGGVLQGADAVGASLRSAHLIGTNAQGANFTGADLTDADLTRVQMDARAFRFTLDGGFADELDRAIYASDKLVAAFLNKGITILDTDRIVVVAAGASWRIADAAGPYDLRRNPSGGIDVFWASPDLVPAVLRGAICQRTKAAGARLSGADLRGVQWYDSGATLDHADLQGACLSGALMSEIDFTQARLDGSDLSGSVLMQAKFRGCRLAPGENRRPVSLEGALLQGADFGDAQILGGLLIDSAVALPRGVPLFHLAAGARQDLDANDATALAQAFSQAGYPLGDGAIVAKEQTWLLDNQADPNPTDPSSYSVRSVQGKLRVFDAAASKYLFDLSPGDADQLNRPTASQALVSAFKQQGYGLAKEAPITAGSYWEIRSDPPFAGPAAYPKIRVYSDSGASDLPVYGAVLVNLRDWPMFSDGKAFGATKSLMTAINPATIGPSGHPRSWVDQGLIDEEALMTVRKGRPPG